MTRVIVRSSFVFLVTSALFLNIVGCAPESVGKEVAGRLATPPKDHGRIIAQKVEETPTRLHWKWSLFGERNWASIANGESSTSGKPPEFALSLENSSPINSTKKGEGCNIWEYDLTAELANGEVRWKTTLHGSNGTTTDAEHREPTTAKSVTDAVRIRQTGDTVARLPASVTLAEVAGKPVLFRIAK